MVMNVKGLTLVMGRVQVAKDNIQTAAHSVLIPALHLGGGVHHCAPAEPALQGSKTGLMQPEPYHTSHR